MFSGEKRFRGVEWGFLIEEVGLGEECFFVTIDSRESNEDSSED